MANIKLTARLQKKISQGREVEIYFTASDNDDIVSVVAPTEDVAFTLLRQPSFLSELKVVVVDAGASISDGDIVVVGLGIGGAAQTETLDVSAGAGTYHTAAQWSHITSITPTSLTGWSASIDTVSIGTSMAAGEDLDSPVLRDAQWAGIGPISQVGVAPPQVNDWIIRGDENELVIESEALIAGFAGTSHILEETNDGGESVTATAIDTAGADEHIQLVQAITSPMYRYRWESANEQTGKFDVSVKARRTP